MKATTGTFNSRAMQYPDGSTAVELLTNTLRRDEQLTQQNKEPKKPTQRQKKRFAELLNLEKLNY